MEVIQEYWFLISGVAIPVATYFVGKYKSKEKDLNLLKNGLCSLERNSLLKSCEDYLNRGWCSIEAKETLNELYSSYHDLGGDSFITGMVNQVNTLPNKEK